MPKQIQTFQQRQTLTMTTTMHQSISILQMSNLELTKFAAQELGKNPFIEDGNISIEGNEKGTNKDKIPQSYQSNQSRSTSSYSSQDFYLILLAKNL